LRVTKKYGEFPVKLGPALWPPLFCQKISRLKNFEPSKKILAEKKISRKKFSEKILAKKKILEKKFSLGKKFQKKILARQKIPEKIRKFPRNPEL